MKKHLVNSTQVPFRLVSLDRPKPIDHAGGNQHADILHRAHQDRPDDPHQARQEKGIPTAHAVTAERGTNRAEERAAGRARRDAPLGDRSGVVEIGFVLAFPRTALANLLVLDEERMMERTRFHTWRVPIIAAMLVTSNPWIISSRVARPAMT